MTVQITYETSDGTDMIERDKWHSEKEGFVIAFNGDTTGIREKTTIPASRVVRIDE